MFTYSVISDKGDRTVNEDAVGSVTGGKISGFIVCDGLGGHGMGDVASSLVVQCFKDELEARDRFDPVLIKEMFEHFNSVLCEKQDELNSPNKVKTTAAVLILDEEKGFTAHIGDSRIYVFANGKYAGRTTDHSVPEVLRLTGQISEEDMRKHPDRNKLLRVIGDRERASSTVVSDPIPLIGDLKFLLCSDGFWEYITESKMEQLLDGASGPDEWLDKMVTEVVKNGSQSRMDNYSAITVWMNN